MVNKNNICVNTLQHSHYIDSPATFCMLFHTYFFFNLIEMRNSVNTVCTLKLKQYCYQNVQPVQDISACAFGIHSSDFYAIHAILQEIIQILSAISASPLATLAFC